MQLPNLSFVEFAILGVLIEGEAPAESLKRVLTEEFDWKGVKGQFYMTIGRMKKFNLIEIHKDVTTTEKRVRQESCYTISDNGKSQWKYAFSFFRSLCDRWKGQADLLPTIETPPNRVEFEKKEREIVRLPNEVEIALILKKSQPEFAVIFRLAIATSQCIISLSAVDVSDVDTQTWCLRSPNLGDEITDSDTFLIPEDCRRFVSRAIAGRSSGPLFLTGNGLPWSEENLRMYWRRIKSRLSLEKGLAMPSSRFLKNVSETKTVRVRVAR